MGRFAVLVLLVVGVFLIGCTSEGPSTQSTWDTPAAYIPPPTDNPTPPASGDQWIGPDGYSGSSQ